MSNRDPLTTPDEINQRLNELITYIDQAVAEVNENIDVDLAGLDFDVAKVIDAVDQLDDDQRGAVQGKLQSMVDSLEDLRDSLKEHPLASEPSDDDNG
jgi:uncharacterized protein YoxC